MDKEQSKKIYVTVYKLIAIIVSIFVFSYAWFVHESDNNLEGVNIGTAKTNNIMIFLSIDVLTLSLAQKRIYHSRSIYRINHIIPSKKSILIQILTEFTFHTRFDVFFTDST